MEAKSVIKVGAVVLVALALFTFGYLYLSHLNPNVYTIKVVFDDTKGLLRQSAVRMQGVTIGEVKSIDLDTKQRPPKPVVTLAIDNNKEIPIGSQFVIISGFLITNPQVEIVPSMNRKILDKDGKQIVQGEPPSGDLTALSSQLQKTLTKFNSTFDKIDKRFDTAYVQVDKILKNTNTLLTTGTATVKSAQGLIGDPKLKASLLESVDNLKQVTVDAKKTSTQLSSDLRALVRGSRGKFDKLSDNLLDLLTKVGNTVDQANAVVAKLTEQVSDPRLQQSLQETAELARTTLARFNQIASDIHQLTGDPQLQNNLKVTVEKLRATTENGQQITEKVNTLLDKVTGKGGKVHTPKLPKVGLVANVSEQFDPARLRVDVDANIAAGQKNFVDFGLYDLGQDTRLNLMLGDHLSNTVAARYGLYASKLGVGLDWTPQTGAGIRADLWDTNHPRLDVRGLFRVNSDASIWVGADGVFRRPVPLIGIQIRR